MINYMSQRITKVLGLIALSGLSSFVSAQPMSWAPAGPVYNAGRARNMIVDKINPQVLYVGSASSGIFKSTNSGGNWFPVNDHSSVRNISYLSQSPDGSIWVGTGEGFLREGQKLKAQPGTGLYKLNEGTVPPSLNMVVSSTVVGTVINRIACHPTNNTHIALATNLGIFYSTDGSTFTKATLPGAPTGTAVSGQDVKFDSNGILYCTIGTEAGTATVTTASKLYKASDASFTSFSERTPTASVLPDNFHGRIELAIAPSDNNIIYASCANKFNGGGASASLKGLFVSYDAGLNWALITQGSAQLDPLTNGAHLATGDYAQVLTVNPTNPHQLFVAGYSFYIFTRTNNSTTAPLGDWTQLSQSFVSNNQSYLHQNIHDIKYVHSASTPVVYFVTDAGVFRSIDLPPLLSNLQANYNIGKIASFQPFYQGMLTGQFNSVSIERFPIGEGVGTATLGVGIVPYSGFIGGTGGNGLTYFSGTYSLVTRELNYLSGVSNGEVYHAEYSKILPDAAFTSVGSGGLYRSTNVKNSNPTSVSINRYVNPLSRISPESMSFSNSGANVTGTAFKLWENYGQVPNPDSAVFYNDTSRYQASMTGVPELTSKTTFTFSTSRPSLYALIDSVVIRTGTVQLPISSSFSNLPTPYLGSERQTIYAGISPRTFSAHNTPTVLTSNSEGPFSAPVTVTMNPNTLIDNISVTFSAPPFANKTITEYPNIPDPAVYYRVFATIFYKYKVGDEVHIVDNNISTRTNSYTAVLTNELHWRYGTLPSYTFSALSHTAAASIQNPTFVLNPGGAIQNTPDFTVTPTNPAGISVFTVTGSGTYSFDATPVVYTIEAVPDPNILPPLVYSISPGNYTQTSTVFTVDPTSSTDYTITESGSNPLTAETYSTVGTTTYVINPATGTVSQSGTVFIVSPSVTTVYTIQGVSSNSLSGDNTSVTYTAYASSSTFSVGENTLPMAPFNKPFKVPSVLSARLAMILNNVGNTGGQDAIVVSKNPLALNDPLSVVRVSQSGAYSDDASGNPTTNSITISGKPTMLEWSKSGTEIYFATSTNRLYRVSHITTIMDLSSASYSGKFYTDIFKYNDPVNALNPNPESPYRTTLIGVFDKPITSISVSQDNKHVALTFSPSATGTTSPVMYNTNDARTSNTTNIGWGGRQGNLPVSVMNTYCSLLEKNDDKRFFIGTDDGLYYTADISNPTTLWTSLSTSVTNLPKVQIFDIKQQVMGPADCYNSGLIYVATNGRGIWTNGTYFVPYIVGVEEHTKPAAEKNLSIYPNPTNGNAFAAFNSLDGEIVTLQIMDISGRVVHYEELGKLNAGEVSFGFNTSGLNAGVYVVNLHSTAGVKRVSKLIVTK
jgi:hypothetical protein